jgi:hypothetical protein
LGNFLGFEPTLHKISDRSGLKWQGKVRRGLKFLEARFTGDNFLWNVVDHGLGALFSDQTR